MKHPYVVLALILFTVTSHAQYSVGMRTLTYTDAARSNRSVAVEIHYPATSNGSNATIVNDSFPFVVFGHGFQMTGSAYYPFADSLARRGYIVALVNTETSLSPSHPNFAQDFIFIYSTLISENSNAASPFYQHVIARGAIGGHSMGGGCTILSAQYSNPATCYFTLAEATTNPSSIVAAASMTKPYLSFAGAYDCIAPYSTNQLPTYDSSRSPCKVLINIIGASHCQFGLGNFQCNFGEGVSGCANPPLSRTAQINTVLRYLNPYLDYYLKGVCRSWTSFDSVYNADAVNAKTRNCTNIVPANTSIAGPTSFCSGSSATLSALPVGFIYSWSSGQTTDSISISTGGQYTVTVGNGTCRITSPAVTETLLSAPVSPSGISGSDTLCANSDSILYTVPVVAGATSYNWSIPSGWSIRSGAGTNNLYLSVNGTTGSVTVSASNNCGNSGTISKTIIVKPRAQLTATITGVDSLCANSDSILYSIPVASGATSYLWTLPSGWSITSGAGTNSVYISVNSTTGPITVSASNSCGASNILSKTIQINRTPQLTGAITGSDTVCITSGSVLYSIPPATDAHSYQWNVPSGWVVNSGAGTNQLSLSFNGVPGTLSVSASNSCGTSNTLSKAITFDSVPHFAGFISGADSVCTGSPAQVYTFVGSTDGILHWAVSAPYNIVSGQGTTALHVSGVSAGGTITLSSSGACGQGTPISLNVVVVDTAHITGTISGLDTICLGDADQVYVFTGTHTGTLLWTVLSPIGIVSGQASDTIYLSGINTTGSISLYSSAICGLSSPLTFEAVVIDTPHLSGTISGADTICVGHPDQAYGFIGSSLGYLTWMVPSTYLISSGQSTTSIQVSGIDTAGVIMLSASGRCGQSSVLAFPIAVIDTPHPSILQAGDTLKSTVAGLSYQWYLDGQLISGANLSYYLPVADGNYSVEVSNANECTGQSVSFLYVNVSVKEIHGQNMSVYPNPTRGVLYITCDESIDKVFLINDFGQKLQFEGNKKALDISIFPNGIYLLKVITIGGQRNVFRISKN